MEPEGSRYQTGAVAKNRLGGDGGCRGDLVGHEWWSANRQSKRDSSLRLPTAARLGMAGHFAQYDGVNASGESCHNDGCGARGEPANKRARYMCRTGDDKDRVLAAPACGRQTNGTTRVGSWV